MGSMHFSDGLTRKVALVAAVVLQASSLGLPALADASVRLGNSSVFTVPVGGGGLTATQRAATMQKNIDNALVASTDKSPNAVAITYVNKQPVLTLGGFYIGSVDAATAKSLGTTQSALAQRWSTSLKASLKNQTAVEQYLAKLTGSGRAPDAGTTTTASGSYPYYKQGRVAYIPAGMMMPVSLSTSLSSETARTGDHIEASLSQPINLGDSEIPAGSVLIGQITNSIPGGRLSHSGNLGLKFTTLRTPDGVTTPITAHIVGKLGKYSLASGAQSDDFRGETTAHKAEVAAIHGAIGAGSGALVGTVIGAISSHGGYGNGVGRGALSGALIGGGLGVAESLLLRKGSNVNVGSGDTFNLQLDAPASIATNSSSSM